MAATGLVLRPTDAKFTIVSTYYKQAPHEPTHKGLLPIDRVDAYGTTFLGLANTILASKRSHIVVVGHGSSEAGLLMKISPLSNVSAGAAMGTLLPVVDSLVSNSGQSASASSLSAAANDWGVPQSEVLKVAKVCYQIRQTDSLAVAVHVRGCNIGANPVHLTNLRKLFRSAVVSAPDSPMFFVTVRPYYPNADVDAWAAKHAPLGRRYKYTTEAGPSAGPMVLDCMYIHGGGADGQAAVRERADIKRWAVWLHQNPQTPAADAFTISGLFPSNSTEYYLAAEEGYLKRIVAVTA